MAAGVRLHHPNLRNCTYTLVHFGRPLQHETFCGACQQLHFDKTYHLALDGVGDVVVSEVVYERVKEAGLGELKVLNEIKAPEPQVLDMNNRKIPNIISRENGQHALKGRT